MLHNLVRILFVSGLIMIWTNVSLAQDNLEVGDTVYVNAFYGGCVKAKVTQTDPKYSVHIEEGMYKDRATFYNVNRINECKQVAPKKNQSQDDQKADKAGNHPQEELNNGNVKVGDRVDVYLSDNKEGKNRGIVLEANGSQYKVHYDGCGEKSDVWENAMFVRPAATISANNAEIKFLVGKWSMNSVGLSSVAVAWGKAGGIQINEDGTYVWYEVGGKPSIKGKWMTHAKIEGTRTGTETENGIIIKDSKGMQWKMYRRKSTIDNNDHINIRKMCEGMTQMGTRVQ